VRFALASGLALSLALAGACASDERSPVRATASGSLILLPGEPVTVHGQPVYTDRTYTFEGLGALAGLRYLSTANDDKTFVARNFLELEAGSRTTIYLALDRRELSVPVPRWLAEEGFHWVRVVLLGLTCDYGSAVTRPLLLIVASILIFPLLYYPCGRWLAGCKLLLVDGEDRSAAPRDVPDSRRWRYCFQLSLVSAFALGGPLDVGKWIERLLPTTISVQAKGGLRTLAGIQSLMGLALLTLWLLNFLGRPFE